MFGNWVWWGMIEKVEASMGNSCDCFWADYSRLFRNKSNSFFFPYNTQTTQQKISIIVSDWRFGYFHRMCSIAIQFHRMPTPHNAHRPINIARHTFGTERNGTERWRSGSSWWWDKRRYFFLNLAKPSPIQIGLTSFTIYIRVRHTSIASKCKSIRFEMFQHI